MPAGIGWGAPLTWPFHPWVIVGVEVTILLYWWGGTRGHRPAPPGWTLARWRAVSFFAALAVILLALNSPLESLATQWFWAHMIQHLLLIVVAAPLLVVAAPWLQIWRGLPRSIRRPVARTVLRHPGFAPVRRLFALVNRPASAWVLAAAVLWLWHVPWLYNLTLSSHLIHHVEHALFLGTGLLFWAQVIDQPPFRATLSHLQRAGYVFAATMQSWALAGVLAFSGAPLYAYADLPQLGGISAMQDQQIGAGIMWVPGAITYAIVFLACLFLWLRDEDRLANQATAGPTTTIARAG
jgi:putative membrane protein